MPAEDAPNEDVGTRADASLPPSGPFRFELRGSAPLSAEERAALARFTVTELPGSNAPDAQRADRAARALELLGQGVGIVEMGGEIIWMNQGLATQSPEVMRRFADCCVEAAGSWRRGRLVAATIRSTFRVGTSWFDAVMTPFRRTGETEIVGAVALLVDATATRRIHDRLDAIDQAGTGLLQFDTEAVRAMNAAERLRALEGRVIAATRSVLGFDHFEFRLTDRRTDQLELVFCSGLVPLGIGERIFARAEGTALHPWATGRPQFAHRAAAPP